MQLYYKEFTDQDRQKVWTTFINKLSKESADTMRVTYDTKEFIRRSAELKEVKWNGREIRNGLECRLVWPLSVFLRPRETLRLA